MSTGISPYSYPNYDEIVDSELVLKHRHGEEVVIVIDDLYEAFKEKLMTDGCLQEQRR